MRHNFYQKFKCLPIFKELSVDYSMSSNSDEMKTIFEAMVADQCEAELDFVNKKSVLIEKILQWWL